MKPVVPRDAGDYDGLWSFGVGSVLGMRSFNVTDEGVLIGPITGVPWESGINKSFHFTGKPAFVGPAWLTPGLVRASTSLYDHEFDKTCACGLYGFYEGSDDYRGDGKVSAIIEGFGKTVIGTRGFRSSKARIKAIYLPVVERQKPQWQRWPIDYAWFWYAVIGLYLAIAALLIFGSAHRAGVVITATLSVPLVVLAFANLVDIDSARRFYRSGSCRWPGLHQISGCGCSTRCKRALQNHKDIFGRVGRKPVSPSLAEKIRKNYPDAEIFDEFHEMVAAYPLGEHQIADLMKSRTSDIRKDY